MASTRQCARCGGSFPSSLEIDGKVRSLRCRKYCLKCSPFGSRDVLRKALMGDPKKCPLCKRTFLREEFGFVDRKRGYRQSYCRGCTRDYQRRKHQILKNKCVEHLGRCCSICGYSRCVAALEFHHKDPRKKEFSLSEVRTVDFSKIVKELSKCVVLCRNCHAEVHEAERTRLLGKRTVTQKGTGWKIVKDRLRL